jgi:hypothetical protein
MTIKNCALAQAGKHAEERVELLAFWAQVVADWADRMPLRDVYVLDDDAGRDDAAPAKKLKIAMEYDENISEEVMRSWQRENSTGFADLTKALGIEIELFTDQDHSVWAPTRDAARTPLVRVRKVRVVRISARAF